MRHAEALWAGPPGLARANCFPPRSSCRATKPFTGGCVDEATARVVVCPGHPGHAALDGAPRAGAESPREPDRVRRSAEGIMGFLMPAARAAWSGLAFNVFGRIQAEANMNIITYAGLVFCAVVAAVAGAAPSSFAQSASPSVVKEMVATWQRAASEIIDVAEAMPEEKYAYKPTPEISTFRDQLVHVAGIAQRFIDSAKGTKSESGSHKAMTKAEVIG